MCAKCIDKMSASEIYGILKGRVISLPDLKKELHDTKAALKQVIHEMILNDVSMDIVKKANKLREYTEVLTMEIKCIGLCSKDISDITSCKSEKTHKKSFRECVDQFVKMKEESSFEPSSVAEFVAESRGQALTKSVRVFTHRIIKDLVLENQVKQISHGLYIRNSEEVSIPA